MTLGFLFGSKNFCKLLCVSWEVFCFARIRLDPLSGQVLHHDCISMIVSRFTLFTKNFMVCCYQVTELFRSRHDCTSEFSARSSCYFGSQADVAISVLREVNLYIFIYILCLPDTTFPRGSEADSQKKSQVRPCILERFHPQDSSYIFLTILADHATVFPVLFHCLHFYLDLGFLLVHATDLSVLFRCHAYSHFLFLAGCCVGTMGSCGTNVGEVSEDEVEELVDRPGTTKGT